MERSPIPGFNGYEADSDGNIWTLKKGQNRVLKPRLKHNGCYLQLSLCVGSAIKVVPVHRLVLLAFRGPPAAGQQCRHLNGIASDNRLDNLAWGTYEENLQDKLKHGVFREKCARGQRQGFSKATPDLILKIRKMSKTQSSYKISNAVGLAPRTVRQIVSGETWSHVRDIEVAS